MAAALPEMGVCVTRDSNESDPTTAPARDRDAKKRYVTPRLVDYGPISKLTQTGGITIADNRARNARGTCL
jgi:hypothetical protein